MLLLNQKNLGEEALNKIARLALKSQIRKAQDLTVRVKTDPNLLAQGKLESLLIDGTGLVMGQNLRMEEMRLHMKTIAVSPFKALMGNIELTQPTNGTACIRLTEADFNRAFNTKLLSDRIQALPTRQNQHPITLTPQSIHCHLLATGKIAIDVDLTVSPTGERQQVTLEATPTMLGQEVVLANCHYSQGVEPYPEFTEILRQKALDVLNLRDFEIQGISLYIEELTVESGQLTVCAIAKMTHFPGKR
ncbi:DUF2993 domain-containing protein [Spirulina subsalsa FACHB-351]|uniref:DUF2993 domain-containing protein n=1 Tax=Spirulina subsalsa FACHB-351 TaxID=234711 RepID=A0ABT3L0N7_9CYAN|nr:DUF2993 domain-containing protein [Spirulina subsalsa]MCW6035062.1 DUF2993 domain-containing protein [Spirulina subsalsa FACHB-351]